MLKFLDASRELDLGAVHQGYLFRLLDEDNLEKLDFHQFIIGIAVYIGGIYDERISSNYFNL